MVIIIREGETFRKRKRSSVSISECGITVASFSLKGHIERQYRRNVPQTREVEMGGGGNSNLYGALPPGTEDGEMPGDRLSGSSA